ncbi:ubiquitin carboxyl-terminal hydrolase [Phycomyces nitens]|nr:ubiquitin carboxyl-terminal hydrolase [Phycomyces nitens]
MSPKSRTAIESANRKASSKRKGKGKAFQGGRPKKPKLQLESSDSSTLPITRPKRQASRSEQSNSRPESSSSKFHASSSKTHASSSKPEASSSKFHASSSKPEASTSKTYASSSKPEASSSKPEASTSKPEASTSKAQASTSKPEASSSKPEASTSKPEASTSKAQASTSKAQASTSKAQESTSKPEASTSKSHPSASKSEASTSKAQKSTSMPEQSTSKAQPSTSNPDPSTSKPEPSTSKPQQSTSKHKLPRSQSTNTKKIHWNSIDHHYEILTKIIGSYKFKEVAARKVYGLDFDEILERTRIYGLIFASTYEDQSNEDVDQEDQEDPDAKDLFFSGKVVKNASITASILNIVLNTDEEFNCKDLVKLSKLSNEAHSDDVARAINKNEFLCNSHNTFGSSVKKSASGPAGTKMDNFVSYLYKDGFVWEANVNRPAPIKLVESTEEEWIDSVKTILEEKIKRIPKKHSYNITALIQDELCCYKRLLVLKKSIEKVYLKRIIQEQRTLDEVENNNSSPEQIVTKSLITLLVKEHNKIELDIEETEKSILEAIEYRDEDLRKEARREHDYYPFIEAFIRALQENSLLDCVSLDD